MRKRIEVIRRERSAWFKVSMWVIGFSKGYNLYLFFTSLSKLLSVLYVGMRALKYFTSVGGKIDLLIDIEYVKMAF